MFFEIPGKKKRSGFSWKVKKDSTFVHIWTNPKRPKHFNLMETISEP